MADSNPFPILPQYQGDFYDAQRRMAIAQALQAQAMAPVSDSEQGWNQMRVVPRMSALSGLSKIGQALMANSAMNKAIGAQRQLGQEQWQGIQSMFTPQSQTSYQATSQDQNGQPTYPPMTNAAPPQSVQSAPQPAAMNPSGMNPTAAAMWYMRDAPGYMKEAVAPFITPTEATKLAMQGGQNVQAANIGALAKANYIAPPEGRPGGYTYLPQVGPNGQVGYQTRFNQPIPAGGMPIYDAAGNQIPGAAPLPGAAGIEQIMAGGKAAGSGQYQLVSGVDANGRPTYRTVTDVASGNTGGPAPSSNFPGYTPPSGGGFAPGLPAGSEGLIKGYTDRYQAGQDAAKNAPQDIQAFRAIDQAAAQAKTGVAFDRSAYWKSMASVIPGIDPNAPDKVNADIIHKYSSQIASRNGGRSDAALESAANSITNAGMSPAAIHELTPSLIGGRMSDLGRSNAATAWLQAHGNAPASLVDFEKQWNNAYDPDAYRLQAMNPVQQQEFIKNLSPQRKNAILQSRQQLRALGALPDMGQ